MAKTKEPKSAGLPKGLPPAVRAAAVEVVDKVGREVAAWWRVNKPSESADLTTLAVALSDVGIVALGHIMRRLESPKTANETKDMLALAIAPRLIAEVRGRVAGAGRRREGASAPAPGMQDLLESYGVAKH